VKTKQQQSDSKAAPEQTAPSDKEPRRRRVLPKHPIPAANKIGTGIAVLGILMFLTFMFSDFGKQTGMPGVCGLASGAVMGLGFAILYWRFTLRFFLILTLICGVSATLTELSARYSWYGPRVRYYTPPTPVARRSANTSVGPRTYRLIIKYNSSSGWVTEEFKPTDLSITQVKLQELDWTDYTLHPTFELRASDGETLEFSGSLSQEKEERKMVAKWQRLRGGENDGLLRIRSRPLESVDEAFALVQAFLANDGSLEYLIEWE